MGSPRKKAAPTRKAPKKGKKAPARKAPMTVKENSTIV